jgi:predicted transposase/invertase (TIGR01784 family)
MKNWLTRVYDRKEGKMEVARNMLNEGMTANTVARITGLTIDDILRL